MRYRGKDVMIVCLGVVAIWVFISTLKWSPKAALFPAVISSIVLLMATAATLLTLFGKGKGDEKTQVMDFQLSKDTDQTLVNRRTLSISLWMLGFLLLVYILGFPITVPLFMFLYLKLEAKEGWGISIGLSAAVWACFYFFFTWFLKTPFKEGWVIEEIRKLIS